MTAKIFIRKIRHKNTLCFFIILNVVSFMNLETKPI